MSLLDKGSKKRGRKKEVTRERGGPDRGRGESFSN